MVELLGNGVIFISILVRFGMIEAFLRFHFSDADQARRDALARRAVGFLLVATTVAAAALAAAAAPLSKLILGHTDTTIFLIAVLGLWAFTNLELAYALLRVDERVRAYAAASLINVAITIAGLGRARRRTRPRRPRAPARQLRRLDARPLRPLVDDAPPPGAATDGCRRSAWAQLLRFGLPTVPAEASVYALSIVDRYYVYHDRSPRQAGLYSIAVKLAGAVAFIVRAFQYAWPPLAYSVTDDAEAARLYGLVTTYYVLISGWVVAGLTLLGRWVLRLLAAPAFYGGYRALPWLALGWAMYGLWVVFLVIAGRAKVTTRNFPAAFAGLAANVILLVLLVPPLGIAGAGIALCGAYVVMLGVMHLLTRRAFSVAFEWRRLAQLVRRHGRDRRGRRPAPAHARRHRLPHPRRRAGGDPAGALGRPASPHPRELAQLRRLLDLGAPEEEPVSRPEVSVVMPFAGSAAEAGEALRALCARSRPGPGDELILVDNSGTVGRGEGGAPVTVVQPSAERSPAHARNVGAAHAARRVDPLPGCRHASAARACSMPSGARRSPTTSARWRGRSSRRLMRRRWRPATARPAAFSASRPTSSTPTARGRPRPTCSCAGPPSSSWAASTRACARPRTPTSPGACRRRGGGWGCARRRRSSTATGPASASCGANGAATPPDGPGWPAATTASSLSRR